MIAAEFLRSPGLDLSACPTRPDRIATRFHTDLAMGELDWFNHKFEPAEIWESRITYRRSLGSRLGFSRDPRFPGRVLQRLFDRPPGQYRAFHPLRKFAHSAQEAKIA